MSAFSVKFFSSAMAGSPQLSNNWGDLITVLDACLVNGFALKVITSLSHQDGLATATIATGHDYQPYQVLELSGADQPEYNSLVRVISASSNQFTFAVPADAPSPATSTSSLSVKLAPLGWDKPFAGTHKAAYRSRHPQSPQNLLLIDDSLKTPGYTSSWAKWANVGIVEDLADIDTPVGAQAPYEPNAPRQNWKKVVTDQWGWFKWYHARSAGYDSHGDGGAGERQWLLIGDERLFYLWCTNAPGADWYGRNFYCFGDIQSFKAGDNFHTILCADDNLLSNANYYSYPGESNGNGLIASLNYTGKVLLRNHTQLGNPTRFGVTSLNTNNSQQISGRGTMPFPNGADYSLWLLPCFVQQEDGHIRGSLPGMLWIPQDRPYSDQTVIDNVVGQAGKRFLLIRTQYASEAEGAQVALDLSGPWW